MRTKDRPIFLERAIKDVMAQSYKNWFLCIINDGGKDSEVDKLVKKYKSHAKQIKVIHHAKSKGMEAASNAGIKSTNGELIVIHDDDDTWHPDFLEESIKKLKEPNKYAEIGGVFSDYDTIYETTNGDIIKKESKAVTYDKPFLSLNDIMFCNQMLTMTFVYYRKCLDKVGLYDESLPVSGDWEFNKRFLMHYDVFHLDKVLSCYHIRRKASCSSLSNSSREQWKAYDLLMENKLLRGDGKTSDMREISIGVNIYKNLRKDLIVFIKLNNIMKKLKKIIFRR